MRYNETKAELVEYEERYRQDSIRLRALEVGSKGVERIARERYFMKRPDEDVFVLSSDNRNTDATDTE